MLSQSVSSSRSKTVVQRTSPKTLKGIQEGRQVPTNSSVKKSENGVLTPSHQRFQHQHIRPIKIGPSRRKNLRKSQKEAYNRRKTTSSYNTELTKKKTDKVVDVPSLWRQTFPPACLPCQPSVTKAAIKYSPTSLHCIVPSPLPLPLPFPSFPLLSSVSIAYCSIVVAAGPAPVRHTTVLQLAVFGLTQTFSLTKLSFILHYLPVSWLAPITEGLSLRTPVVT